MIGPAVSIPIATSCCARTCSAAARDDRPGSINPKRVAVGHDLSIGFDCRHGAFAEEADRHLGIERLLAVAGGSMGGMQALEWAVTYRKVSRPRCRRYSSSQHNRSRSELSRQPIMADPDWCNGNYYSGSRGRGLRRAHGGPHHVHERQSMREKFGRRLRKSSFEWRAISIPRIQVRRPFRRELIHLHRVPWIRST
jgi:pimeloyl-ACP methyl ester carboxylesterase